MEIPLSSPDITEKEKTSVLEVLNSSILSQGEKIKTFEEMFCKYTGQKHSIAVNSGTSALHLAVKTLGLNEGDEIITSPFSFIASANCILMEKLKPVFVDIERDTFNIDPDKIEEKITDKTRAILAVHIFGLPADMDKINEIAKKHSLQVIEDACESLGTEFNGKRVGSGNNTSIFAFYPNKQITTGEGGMIVTSDDKIAELCRSLRNQGRNIKGDWLVYERMGYNYRMSELNATLGVAQMERLDEILNKRNKISELYESKLKNLSEVKTISVPENTKISWFVYIIKVNEKIRDKLMSYLESKGIQTRPYFPPIHFEPFYKEMGYKEGDFPITEEVSKQTMALPFHNNLSEEEIDYVVEAISDFFKFP